MEKNIKEYLPFYLGCECMIGNIKWKKPNISPEDLAPGVDFNYGRPIKAVMDLHTLMAYPGKITPILRKLSSMTEDDFNKFAIHFYGSDKLVFAKQGNYWYACSRELDPDYEGTPMEYINDCGDDDPANVLMCHAKTKSITYGWITYNEIYHSFSVTEEAEVIRYLLSKGFDLFGLIESGLAMEKK